MQQLEPIVSSKKQPSTEYRLRRPLLGALALICSQPTVYGVRVVETLRRTADAVLPGEHADQPCGERRRGMLTTCGIRTDSESAILVAP